MVEVPAERQVACSAQGPICDAVSVALVTTAGTTHSVQLWNSLLVHWAMH